MRAPRSLPYGRPGRVLALGVMVSLVAGCAAVPAPSAPPAVPTATPPAGVPGPDAPAAPSAPEGSTGPIGIGCGGPLEPPVAARVRLADDAPLAATLGATTALGLSLLGDGRVGGGDGDRRGAAGCGDRILLAPSDDVAARLLAATTAAVEGAPLLLLSGRTAEVDDLPPATRTVLARRLDANDFLSREVVRAATPQEQLDGLLALLPRPAAGPAAGSAAGSTGASSIVLVAAADVAMQAELVARSPGGAWPLVVGKDDADLRELAASLARRAPDVTLHWAASDAVSEATLRGHGVDELASERWDASVAEGRSAPTELWLGDVREPGLALTAAVAAAARGAAFVAVDGSDLRAGPERTARIRRLAALLPPDGTVVLAGGGPDADWQLDTVLEGTLLPDGGFLPLEDRRIVALYGSPGTPSLGILGEQDLEATLERARELAAGYADAADGRRVVPGLDVIVTVASSVEEATGDYSRRVPVARLRPLVERAGEEGIAVILDLQPGRTDFLTQAKEYEELLLLPHVHLALDPEWRIGPTERHLQRIGSVEAAEVQAVADWLAALVRRERLPQKVFMLHQFVLPMLPDRDTIVVPLELVGVVHVDGQGPLPTKERTYAVMTDGAEERWAWGWKNFTRIDVPVATPERTLDRTPVPLIVTYQ